MGRIARIATMLLAAASAATFVAGCTNDAATVPAKTTAAEPKTEMVFLARYEKLRTQACPITTERCAAGGLDAPAAASARETCVTDALKNVPTPTLPQGAHSKTEIDAWLLRNSAAVHHSLERCNRMYGGHAYRYGRAYGNGHGWGGFPSATANMSGEPVEVIVD